MEVQNETSVIKRQSQKSKHIKRMENNCHFPDVVHAFSYVGYECHKILSIPKS